MSLSIELYIHIPYCIRKCVYCDFNSYADRYRRDGETYFRALKRELKWRAAAYGKTSPYSIRSVFIGGGTPSVADTKEILSIMRCIFDWYSIEDQAEITIETNPGTIDHEKCRAYYQAGINRLSLGFQSLDDEILQAMGRIHSSEKAVRAYSDAVDSGFENINIDLMLGFPGQRPAVFEKTLAKVIQLRPQHISAYSLLVEEGTALARRIAQGAMQEPGQEEDRQMYRTACQWLPAAGYERYEVSNFALPGFASIHNLGYWTGVPYLGVGLGAASYLEGIRFRNTEDMEQYLKGTPEEETDRDSVEILSKKDRMDEFMMLGFRLAKGPDPQAFWQRFGQRYDQVYTEPLKRLEEQGLIQRLGRGYCLSEKGLDYGNLVFEEFV